MMRLAGGCLSKKSKEVSKTRPEPAEHQQQQPHSHGAPAPAPQHQPVYYHHPNQRPSHQRTRYHGGGSSAPQQLQQQQQRSASSASSSSAPAHRVLNSRERQARAALLKEYYFQQSGQSAYPDAYRQPSYDMSTTTWSDSSSAAEEDDENPLVTTKILPDPCPTVNPKSQKMALGSITFSGEQGIPLGVMTKDNSFFLRVEKCHPEFCGLLNYEIEKMHNFSCPYDAEDKTEYWPEGALNNYCQNMNPDLWAAMTKVYRNWHDTRSGMESLCARLTQLKEKRAARYGKD